MIHKTILRGDSHPVFAEDFLYVFENSETIVAAVFDGCSSGEDSQFASGLMGKLLQKICKKSVVFDLKEIVEQLVFELKKQQIALDLSINEMLTTMIIGIVSKKSRRVEVLVVGDGMFAVNGIPTIIDQDNRPDYLAYHLSDIQDDNSFESWFSALESHSEYLHVEDLFLATDGIFSYVDKQNSMRKQEEIDEIVLNYFCRDDFLIENKSMLKRKSNILQKKYFFSNYDDLAMIRIVLPFNNIDNEHSAISNI